MSLWQRFYRAILDQRRRRAQHSARRIPRPVISLGNLHWGGGGKTPMTASVASHLRDRGHRVVVLSRGHGRKSRGPLIVSRGEGAVVSVEQSGDEPALLARLEGVSVVVAEKRYEGGVLALCDLDCDLFLLDDGFSHVQLARDLEILLFPAADPLGGSGLLPSGRLREPLSAASHADAVVLTGVGAENTEPDAELASLVAALSDASPQQWSAPAFISRAQAALSPQRPIERALLVTAVARPKSVRKTAEGLAKEHGFCITDAVAFRDHHPYPQRSLDTIQAHAQAVDTVLVTGKDWVKLAGRLKLPEATQLVEIEHRAEPEVEFFSWLDHRLTDIQSAPPAEP